MSFNDLSRVLNRPLSRRDALRAGGLGVAATASGLIGVNSTSAMMQNTDENVSGEEQSAVLKDLTQDEPTLVQRVNEAIAGMDAVVQDAMERTGAPGLAVGVVHRDEAAYLKGFGVRQAGTSDAVGTETVFQLASISKSLASTVVAGLVADDIVDWDSRLSDLMPEFLLHDPLANRDVTIRDMFSHRSGLPDHAGDAIEDLGYNRDEVLHRLRHQKLAASLRAEYAYTNFGLTAAAVAAAREAGGTWEDISAEWLYGPVGMTRTSSRFDDYMAHTDRAHGHAMIDGEWKAEYVRNPDAQSPAGGASASIRDMAQFTRLHLAGGWVGDDEIVPATALDETYRPQMISSPPADPASDLAGFYGLGWNVGYDRAGRVRWSHSGAFALGASTALFIVPSWDVGICVLTNIAPIGLPEAIAYSFMDLVDTGEVQNDYVAIFQDVFKTAIAPWYESVDVSPPANPSPALAVGAYTGIYDNPLFGPAEVVADGDSLSLHLGPEPLVHPMRHHSRDTFVYQPVGENAAGLSAVTFSIDADGIASDMLIDNLDADGQGRFARRVTDE